MYIVLLSSKENVYNSIEWISIYNSSFYKEIYLEPYKILSK